MAPDAPSPETRQSTFESGVALSLHLWSSLTFAVENNLGGSDGASKRDWFAGAIVELYPDLSLPTTTIHTSNSASANGQPSADDLLMDTESRLLQIMDDEFDTIVDDDSTLEVAEQILGLWRDCGRGKFEAVDNLRTRWEAGKGKKVSGMFKEGKEEDQDTDWDTDDDEEEEDGDGDVEMGGAEPKERREKPPPEVDEDGFTKVSHKKR